MTRWTGAAIAALLTACSGGGGMTTSMTPDAGMGGQVTQRIGAAGGSLVSADGAFTLTVPAGALAADTDLTVREVANTAPNGIGSSFRVEPAGLTLAQPLQVALRVDPTALDAATEDVLGIAVRNAAGDWFADLRSAGDEAVAMKRRGAQSSAPLVTTLILKGEDVYEVTVSTFWRVQPLDPMVNTGESVTITVQACYSENQTIVAGPGLDLASLPRPECGASIREGTWSVVGAGSGNAVLGHVAAGAPSSTAIYTAPRRAPRDPVILEVSLFWRERGLTKKMRIPVIVNGSDDWTGTVEYQVEGTSTTTDETGATTTDSIDSTGTIQVHSLPGGIGAVGGPLAAESAVVSYRHTTDVHGENIGGSCQNLYTRHEVVQGSEALFPSLDFAGDVGLILDAHTYTLSLSFVILINVTDDWTDTYTTRCPGEDEVVVTSMDHLDDLIPGVIFPPQTWSGAYDPTSTGPIVGSTSVDYDGARLTFSWTLSPP